MDIDSIRINFNPGQMMFLNVCLAFLMFGVALELKPANFKYLLQKPRLALIGLASQLLLLPLLTLLLIYTFRPPTSIALGMVIVAACPGGNVSNFAVHLAKANAALSILLTSITTIAAIVVTPAYFLLMSHFIPGTGQLSGQFSLSPGGMLITILQLIILPVAAGMSFNHFLPRLTEQLKKPVKILSIVVFLGFIVFATAGNYEYIVDYVHLVFLLVFTHNSLALLTGYGWSIVNGLAKSDARAIALETGIQNSGLGLIIIFNFFDGLGGMAMIAAWWGIWHLLSAFTLANIWAYRPAS